MKINKSFLSKIIKEEIKKTLYETHQPWEHELVQFLVQIYKDGNEKDRELKPKEYYINKIKSITKNQDVSSTLQYLKNEDAVDHDMYRYVVNYLLNDKTSNLFSDYSDYQLPASYKDTTAKYRDMSDIRSPYETNKASTYGRRPKPIDQEDQEDIRRKKRT